MKKLKLILLSFLLGTSIIGFGQQVLTKWTFDRSDLVPDLGNGTLTLLGGIGNTFAGGTSGSGLNTNRYPVQGNASGTAGIECALSTVGYQHIRFRFNHRASGTASRYALIDYSIDAGQNWISGYWSNGGMLSPSDNFAAFTVDFSNVLGANNNPDFRVRIVSVFSPCDFVENSSNTVIPANTAYMRANTAAQCAPHTTTSGGSYAPTGTWRFDDIAFVGEQVSGFIFPLVIDKPSFKYTQDFNGLALDGTANLWEDNVTLPAWYWQFGNPDRDPNNVGYRAHAGDLNSINAASLGALLDSDRAFGGISGSSGRDLFIGFQIQNNSGRDIDLNKLFVSFVGEQWRATSNQFTLDFAYQVSPIALLNLTQTQAGWTQHQHLNFTPPTTDIGVPIDGNDSLNGQFFNQIAVDSVGVLPNGSYLMLRWSLSGTNAPALALDDFVFEYIEEPIIEVDDLPLQAFNQVVGIPSLPQFFSVKGDFLTQDVSVKLNSTRFELAISEAGPFQNTLTLSQTDGSLSDSIWVRLNAAQAGSFNDSLYVVYKGDTLHELLLNGVALNAPVLTISPQSFNQFECLGNILDGFSNLQPIHFSGQHLQGPVFISFNDSASDNPFGIALSMTDFEQNLQSHILVLTPVNGVIDDTVFIGVNCGLFDGLNEGQSLVLNDTLLISSPLNNQSFAFPLEAKIDKLVNVAVVGVNNAVIAYPNPVLIGQKVTFSEDLNAAIFDMKGSKVAELKQQSEWNTAHVFPGVYMLVSESGFSVKLIVE